MLALRSNERTLSPAEAARRVLDVHWNGRLPVDPGAIAEDMGVSLIPRSDWSYSGYYSAFNAMVRGPVIEYNRTDSLVRRRFTVAHELGHHVLGHEDAPRDDANSFGATVGDPVERAANQFAAELLMPAEAVRRLVSSGHYESSDELAEAFKVSKVAMTYRLRNLNLGNW